MIRFSKFQKEIISYLIRYSDDKLENGYKSLLDNYYTQYFNRALIVFPEKTFLSLFCVYNGNETNYKEEVCRLIEILVLFRTLENSNYITLFPLASPAPINFIYDFGGEDKTEEYKTHFISEMLEGQNCILITDDIHKLIIKYFFSILYISPDLKELVNNGFITFEEKAQKSNMNIAWTAIGFSVLLGIVSIYITYDKVGNSEIKTEIQNIDNTLKQKSLPKVVKAEIVNDTINIANLKNK
nr:hypothetical protein [uncultured Bacteroides sp.]